MITQNELKEKLDYNPETGVFTWKTNTIIRNLIGKIAGTANLKGYIEIQINLKKYKAHRLAWLYVHGEWPKNEIDHINGIKDDNRIENLRDVTRRVNESNKQIHRDGHLVGTRYLPGTRKWGAEIQINRKKKYLGTFNTQKEAHGAYMRELKFLEENGDKNNVGGIES